MSRASDLELAQDLSEAGEVDEAYRIANRYLKFEPHDAEFLTVMVHVLLQSDKAILAYALAKQAVQGAPKASGTHLNLGMACQDLWLTQEAIRAYKRSIELSKDNDRKLLALINMCAVLIDSGRFVEAEPYAKQALEINPDSIKARSNLGFCELAQRKWVPGWSNYRLSLGVEWRPINQYGDEPEWDGKPCDRIALYAEQGIGDVIGFASMVPDVQKICKNVVLDIDPKLVGLFRRSFPDVSVYGTRFIKERLPWKPEDAKIDASFPMGQVAEYVRLKDEDFPGTAYLKADPDRVFMWKALFQKKKKPVIGIAWRGGIMKTGAKYRQWNLEQLYPLLSSVDAHWVSLQYKDAEQEIADFRERHPEIDIVQYKNATLTDDYDDTAALVYALDHLVCMQSAVTHLAGALGKPVWVFVPQNSQWRYGGDGEDYVWSKSVRIIRQTKRGKWDGDINRVAEELSAKFPPKTSKSKQRKKRKRPQTRHYDIKADRRNGSRPSP
jgi:tetratricopeptide (TPR) repeat protein